MASGDRNKADKPTDRVLHAMTDGTDALCGRDGVDRIADPDQVTCKRCLAKRWEARSAMRYGSQHCGWFANEEAARAFADEEIRKAGGVGAVTTVYRRVVYFNVYASEDE